MYQKNTIINKSGTPDANSQVVMASPPLALAVVMQDNFMLASAFIYWVGFLDFFDQGLYGLEIYKWFLKQ